MSSKLCLCVSVVNCLYHNRQAEGSTHFPRTLTLDEEAAENLARGRFRYLRDELDAPDLLVRRDVRRDEAHHLRLGQAVTFLDDDESLRHLARLVVRARDDRRVGDRVVS